ncbi:MAG TPA: 30S ribosomal protein S4e [Candidatus Lokiarchaeia archaeon]|nr:30S ribosomal protein S4e [Candidatus Lokiarchaeia archaeon]
MARKGHSLIVRRLNAPTFWRIARKHDEYAAKPKPGPHPAGNCFTILYVLRDLLKVARSLTEAKKILNQGGVMIDGKIRKNPHFPVGLMDIIEIPGMEKAYRVLPDPLYNLKLSVVTEDTQYKLCKIENKSIQRGGIVQLNMHDGRNILIKTDDVVYHTNDVVKIDLKSGEIVEQIPMKEGMLAIVHDGLNNGRMGKITKITRILKNDVVTLDDKGTSFETRLKYVFVLGEGAPAISLGI